MLGIVALAVAGIIWLGNAVEKEEAAGGPSEAVAEVRPANLPPPRIRQRNSWPIPAIDSASWKVRADPIPLADDLPSAVSLGGTSGTKHFFFSDPAAGKVLFVEASRLQWIDLRSGEMKSLQGKPVLGSPTREPVAISPSGERFATISSELTPPKISHSLEVNSCRDGSSIGKLPIDRTYDTLETSFFLDENRIIHYQAGRLRAFDFEQQKLVYEASIQFKTAPELTPGRKWIYGRTANGYEFYDTLEGKPAGSIQMNGLWRTSKFSEFNIDSRLVIDSDGRRALLVAPISTFVDLIAVDLDSGKVKEHVTFEDIARHDTIGLRASWASDTLVVFDSGYVLDFSTKALAMNYSLGRRTPLKYSGYLPNRRTWLLESNKRLVSAVLPDPADVAASGDFGNYPWPIGTPLRVEANGPGDVAFQTGVVELVAKALAERGFPIDPNAKARVSITTGPISKGDVRGSATDAEVKREERWNSNKNNDGTKIYYKLVKGLKGDLNVETFDLNGKQSSIAFQCHAEVVGYNAKLLLNTLSGNLKTKLDSGELDKPRYDPSNRSRLIGRDIPIKIEGANTPTR